MAFLIPDLLLALAGYLRPKALLPSVESLAKSQAAVRRLTRASLVTSRAASRPPSGRP